MACARGTAHSSRSMPRSSAQFHPSRHRTTRKGYPRRSHPARRTRRKRRQTYPRISKPDAHCSYLLILLDIEFGRRVCSEERKLPPPCVRLLHREAVTAPLRAAARRLGTAAEFSGLGCSRPLPCLSCPFAACVGSAAWLTSPAVVVPSAHLRVLLLRRLRLPLPCAPRTCSCHGRLDQLGDHRSACATSGFLASRALPLEHAVARVCREAGAQVAGNVRVGDMNIDVPVSDARRIEV